MMGMYITIIGIVVLVLMNVAASIYIGSADAYEANQKRLQIALIWLIPVIGALGLSYFLNKDRKSSKKRIHKGNDTSFTNNDSIEHWRGTEHHGGRE